MRSQTVRPVPARLRKDDEARIVHKGIHTTVSGNSEFDNALARAAVLEILMTGSGNTPGGIDFGDHCVRDRGIETGSILRDACIMNDEAAPAGSN
jgi:hypothetical protein